VYRSKSLLRSQRFRWRLVAANGRVVAESGEGYANRAECVETAIAIICGAYKNAHVYG
jgi:uncharacterized protein YegP (UPF0339 family)